MERQDYINQITMLKDTLEQLKETNASLLSAMESSAERNKSRQEQVCSLQEIISGLTDEIRSLREEVSKRTDYNKRYNKKSFDKKGCEEAKMDHGGSQTSTNTASEQSEKGKSDLQQV